MGKRNQGWILIVAVLLIVAILILPRLGLFSIYSVGTSGGLTIKYQRMDGNCVVRIERNKTTTWIGPYDFENSGQKNLDIAKSIGWVDENNSQGILDLLKKYYPDENCNPVLYVTEIPEEEEQEEIINNQTGNGAENGTGNGNQINETINQFHESDLNKDGIISESELLTYSEKWISGEISREKLHEAISIWRENL